MWLSERIVLIHEFIITQLKTKCFPLCAAWCSRMHMDNPVMEDARATPICSHLHDNVSYILLGRVYWQGRKAVWAGRKHFTLDIRSGGTEQPVCECARVPICAFAYVCQCTSNSARVVLRESECVGHVWACVCVWVSSIPIRQSHQWAALCLGRKMNRARRAHPAAVVLLQPFPPDSPWVGQTHLAGHHNTTLTTISTGSWHIKMPAFLACWCKQYKWITVKHTTTVCISQTGARVAPKQAGSSTHKKHAPTQTADKRKNVWCSS